MERGKIVRSATAEVNATGRTTQGVIFAKPDNGDRIIAVARNTERHLADEAGTVGADNGQVSDVADSPLDPEVSVTDAVTDTSAEDA
jgi:DNA gyrase subunit A